MVLADVRPGRRTALAIPSGAASAVVSMTLLGHCAPYLVLGNESCFRVLPHRRPVYPVPLGDRHRALAVRPSGSNSFYFLLRQRGSTTFTRVLDDVYAFVEHERPRRLEDRRSLDPREIKAIQPAHEVPVGYLRYHALQQTHRKAFGEDPDQQQILGGAEWCARERISFSDGASRSSRLSVVCRNAESTSD